MTNANHPANPRTKRVGRAIRWLLMMAAGCALWMFGLGMLGVLAVLPPWQQVAAAVPMVLAVLLWLAA